jgi:N-acetylglucosamine-6-phosphate deacetylase
VSGIRRLGVARALVDGELVEGDVEVDAEGVIRAVGVGSGSGSHTAVPGLVDLQVNGVAGIDLRAAGREGYADAAEVLARNCATAVQPTIYSQPLGAPAPLSCSATCSPTRRRAAGCCPHTWKGRSCHRCGGEPIAEDLRALDLRRSRACCAGPVGCMTLLELDGALDLIAHLVGPVWW